MDDDNWNWIVKNFTNANANCNLHYASSLTAAINEQITSTEYAGVVKMKNSDGNCAIEMDASSTTVTISPSMQKILGFNISSFTTTTLATNAFNPLALIPYVIITSENLVEPVGDDSQTYITHCSNDWK